MFPFRKILFPVDYSEFCNALPPYVRDMIKRFSADLTLLHAYGIDFSMHGGMAQDASVLLEVQGTQNDRLRQFAAQNFAGQHVECLAKLGEAGSVIDSVVRHQGTDLVMLPTHGHRPIRQLLLGSIAAKVLHDVSAAVWTIAGSPLLRHPPALPYKSVICALDDSEEAEGVLRAAAAFARTYDARLSLVQVVELPPPTLDIDVNQHKKRLMEKAQFRIRELKGNAGVSAPHAVIDATVAEGILGEALRQEANIIVTGRGHTQTRVSRMWSHFYELVRESTCPILSI